MLFPNKVLTYPKIPLRGFIQLDPNGTYSKGVVQVASACHTEILEIPCLVLSQKMVLIVSFDKLLVELAQAAGPSLAALAWSCSFRNLKV